MSHDHSQAPARRAGSWLIAARRAGSWLIAARRAGSWLIAARRAGSWLIAARRAGSWLIAALLVVLGAQTLGASPAQAAPAVEISAPLFPRTDLLYSAEREAYPTSIEQLLSLAQEAFYDFESLLALCATRGYEITPLSIYALSEEQRFANYDEVARCAYDELTAKPYYIPQLLLDIDVCREKLGPDWRMLTSADVAEWPASLFEQLASILAKTTADAFPSGGGAFYFTLYTYGRAADGSLVVLDLRPGQSTRVLPLPANTEMTFHLEQLYTSDGFTGPIGLRCVRQVELL